MSGLTKYVFIRGDGLARHPDDMDMELSDEAYIQQFQRYIADTGDLNAPCSRACMQVSESQVQAMAKFSELLRARD